MCYRSQTSFPIPSILFFPDHPPNIMWNHIRTPFPIPIHLHSLPSMKHISYKLKTVDMTSPKLAKYMYLIERVYKISYAIWLTSSVASIGWCSFWINSVILYHHFRQKWKSHICLVYVFFLIIWTIIFQ